MSLRTTAPLLALLGLLTAGCSGGDPQPRVLPSLSPMASPSVVAADIPPAARPRTAQGADAFVRYFFTQLNQAFATSDAALIRSLTNGECATCENYEKALAASRRSGHFVVGDSFVVKDVAAAPLQLKGTLVEVFGSIPDTTEVDGARKRLRTLSGEGPFHFTVAVKWNADHWAVSGIRLGGS